MSKENTQNEPVSSDGVRLSNLEAAEYLGLKTATLNKWRVFGIGPPFIKVGRLVQYRKADLDHYLSGRVVSSTTEATVNLST